MTPQSTFMIVAPVETRRVPELRRLLESMNAGPGQVNPDNALVPFARFDTLHFARFVILDDQTQEDVKVYGLPVTTYPVQLAFLGDVDGSTDEFFAALVREAEPGLRSIFCCCQGFDGDTDLGRWLERHDVPVIAGYVNCRGRTVRRVREEAALKGALDRYVCDHAAELSALPPRDVLATVQRFVAGEQAAARLRLSPDDATPFGWWLRNLVHAIGVPVVTLALLPLIVVVAPFYLIRLRQLEKSDPELCARGDPSHSEALARDEDRDVTNQFNAMASRKPGLVRLVGLIGVLVTVNYAARHLVRPGRLGRIRTIHFARWVLLDGANRGTFFSNYDGTVESYMDDFINKAGFGLNAIFCNAIGYPRTNWLFRDGCEDEQKYRNFLRRHTLPSQVWYKAYPALTAIDLERNRRIREGIEARVLNDTEVRDWVALL